VPRMPSPSPLQLRVSLAHVDRDLELVGKLILDRDEDTPPEHVVLRALAWCLFHEEGLRVADGPPRRDVPDLSIEDMPISTEGMLSLPLLGAIKAEGLTTAELADTVTQRLANGVLQHPAVSVNVKQYGSHVVTVEGAVEKPGVYSYGPGARLSTAIALASGLNRVAKSSQVAVFRKTPQGIAIAKFDYGAVASGTMLDPVLEPGDRVVVGTSGLSQFWQDLLKALPAFALFTNLNI